MKTKKISDLHKIGILRFIVAKVGGENGRKKYI